MGAEVMKYVRVTENGFSNARLIPDTDSLFELTQSGRTKPWFYSTYKFNEEHKDQFNETGSVAGIRDVTANMLWWDFDNKDISKAQEVTKVLVDRLIDYGFEENTIKINYSGNKGFHVTVDVDRDLTPNQVEAIAHKFASDLEGFDESLYDATQVLRVPLTKHEKSKVYCTPITVEQLRELTAAELKKEARSIKDFDVEGYVSYYQTARIPEDLLVSAIVEKPKQEIERDLSFDTSSLDMKDKPRYLDEARWLLVNGFFRGSGSSDVGERNYALLCLAATYKNLGYDEALVRGILNGVIELQAARTGEEPFDEWELDNNIIGQVFSETWNGGQFSLTDPTSWLHKYALRMGIDPNKNITTNPIRIKDIAGGFKTFVENIEKNTVKTGIKSIDESMPITTGMNLGLIGAASSGKTALALEILKNTSKAGVPSVVASLDMHRNRLFEKLLYKVSGLPRKELYHRIKTNQADDIIAKVEEDYGNVWFYDRSAATVNDIRRYVQEVERTSGQKIKLVMIDYFERVNSDVSDDTAASKRICNELQDMINDMDIAMITIVQPNKFSLGGGPDKPILNYTAIKGSSFLYQSFRSVLSLWRPFFRPDMTEHDKYMQMAILKNDLGELGMFDFAWNGKRGEIKELDDVGKAELKALIKWKENQDAGDDDDGWG